MHIILSLLGAIITILILLNRLDQAGIDIGWLNPYAWRRRRAFRQRHDMHSAFTLDSPMDVAALYMVAVAKFDGDISKEQKEKIIHLYESEFKLSTKQARDLLSASVYLLGQADAVYTQPHKVVESCIDKISPEQSESIAQLIDEVAKVEGTPSQEQATFIANIKNACPKPTNNKW